MYTCIHLWFLKDFSWMYTCRHLIWMDGECLMYTCIHVDIEVEWCGECTHVYIENCMYTCIHWRSKMHPSCVCAWAWGRNVISQFSKKFGNVVFALVRKNVITSCPSVGGSSVRPAGERRCAGAHVCSCACVRMRVCACMRVRVRAHAACLF